MYEATTRLYKKIDWEAINEPAVLAWQIKTIGHQWQKPGYFCIFVIAISYGISLAILIHGYQFIATPLVLFTFGSVFTLVLFGEVRRKPGLFTE